ncbi:MAG: hypothetical protein PHQ52_04410 [Candidatus Omnitrophica bacterium]|nr:hypothetical protein [Candidatus Omnitrophota bacterium]
MRKEVFAFIILTVLCSCLLNNISFGDILGTKEDKHFVQINGTVSVSFLGIEQGASYVIEANDGKTYKPEDLAQAYRRDGLKVYAEGWVPKRILPFESAQIPLSVTKIERVKE